MSIDDSCNIKWLNEPLEIYAKTHNEIDRKILRDQLIYKVTNVPKTRRGKKVKLTAATSSWERQEFIVVECLQMCVCAFRFIFHSFRLLLYNWL